MEVSAYLTSVHITVFGRAVTGTAADSENGSICLFHKCPYTVFWTHNCMRWSKKKRRKLQTPSTDLAEVAAEPTTGTVSQMQGAT